MNRPNSGNYNVQDQRAPFSNNINNYQNTNQANFQENYKNTNVKHENLLDPNNQNRRVKNKTSILKSDHLYNNNPKSVKFKLEEKENKNKIYENEKKDQNIIIVPKNKRDVNSNIEIHRYK